MTILCAVRDGSAVWIGADSRATAGGFVSPVPHEKWSEQDGWQIGVAGYERMRTLMRLNPFSPSGGSIANWSADAISEFLYKLAHADGWKPYPTDHGPQAFSLNLILVSPDLRVFETTGGGSVTEAGEEFVAAGSGCEYAYGAAFALRISTPEARIDAALKAACQYNCDCGPPLFMKKIGGVASVADLAQRHLSERMVPRSEGAPPVGSLAWLAEGARFRNVVGKID